MLGLCHSPSSSYKVCKSNLRGGKVVDNIKYPVGGNCSGFQVFSSGFNQVS